MKDLIPKEVLTFHDFDACMKVAEVLLDEGYALLLGREESLYTLNYIWTGYGDRNDVVFMNRDDFEYRFYEEEEEESDHDREQRIRQQEHDRTETEIWWYARKMLGYSPATIEKVFCLDMMSEEEQDRFWAMFPDQLTYPETKRKIDDYEELRNAALGERIMEACLDNLDKHNQWKYDQAMRKEECNDAMTYANDLDDIHPDA